MAVILGALGALGGPEFKEFVDMRTIVLKFPVPWSLAAATWKLLTMKKKPIHLLINSIRFQSSHIE